MQTFTRTGHSRPTLRLARGCDVSVVVPTLNEAANLPALLGRIDTALAGRTYEVILVDDNSTDGTEATCHQLVQRYPLRLIVRAAPAGGLSGAVIRGMTAARGETIVVMDADLQHPPEKIPALLAELRGGAEFALGSRYVSGGSTEHGWGRWRRANSNFATLLAKPFAGDVRDPMSGFFALKAETFDRATRLNPVGYKIALELICKCRVKDVVEVPIAFGVREAGESKLSWKQRGRFIQHLGRLYGFRFPRVAAALKLGASGGLGGWFSAVTNPLMTPLIVGLAMAAVGYTTRAGRPATKPLVTPLEDREVKLPVASDVVELAA